MRYIRTKDGNIFEKKRERVNIVYYENKDYTSYFFNEQNDLSLDDFFKERGGILKQADTIEELIMPGDLVRYDGLYMSWIEKDRGDKVRGIDMHLIPRVSVDMLWIPTGNDTECYPNFKLVASKENEKGELELC